MSRTGCIFPEHEKAPSTEMKEDNVPSVSRDSELAEALRNYVPRTADEKKLVKKIDIFLMPILWLMYILNYIDRTNIVSLLLGSP